jgi:hypothetical protein
MSVVRVPVAELLAWHGMDAREHRPGPACPPALAGWCACAGSVARRIALSARPDGGACTLCGSRKACRLPDLLDVLDRDGAFSRPIHGPGRTVHNGHHRLAAAMIRELPDLDVDTRPREELALATAADAQWLEAEIAEAARQLPGRPRNAMLAEHLEYELSVDLPEGSPGRARALQIARAALA